VGVPGEIEQLSYDLARGALAEQDRAIDELRARTGTLLAASSIVASFLGGRALDAHGFNWESIVALGCFGAAALFACSSSSLEAESHDH
jgi:hypothetical protein